MNASTPAAESAIHRLRAYWPAPTAVDAVERVRMVRGAALAIGLTALCAATRAAVLRRVGPAPEGF
jgi:hypothetical protein